MGQTIGGKEMTNELTNIVKSELVNAATEYVFEENGHKFSNNTNEAGDNFASFIAGANWALNKMEKNND
jgi:hypothetical protein